MSKKQLAIYGAGGLGRELRVWMGRIPDYEFIGFFDDGLPAGSVVDGCQVIGGIDSIKTFKDLYIVIAVGDAQVRKTIASQLTSYSSLRFPVVIHPKAIIEDPDSVKLGEGSVITAGCVLTTGINVGRHVLINLNSTIGHDCSIGDGSCIMPGVNVSGTVQIGKNVLIGTGASILNNLSIGDNSKIGAGAVVLNSIRANCTAVGIPAKVISS